MLVLTLPYALFRTRMELERKITELNQLKNQVALIHLLLFTMQSLSARDVGPNVELSHFQLAQTEQRERELASRVAT